VVDLLCTRFSPDLPFSGHGGVEVTLGVSLWHLMTAVLEFNI